jgi:hypothetical protein
MKKETDDLITSTAWLIATLLLLAVTLGSCKTTTQCDAYGKIKNYKKL